MRKLIVQLQWAPNQAIIVGQLAEVDHRIYFEYDGDFLRRGWQLSPFKLPLRPALIEHTDRAFGPLPGVFDDSLPDGWGLLLMDRMFRQRGIDPATVSPLERLSYIGTRAMGALTYHPSTDLPRDDRLIDLQTIGENAEQTQRGAAVVVLPELMRAGGSPGGARPKILVGVKDDQIITGEAELPDGFTPWIIKFRSRTDDKDAASIEFAYAEMARAAGIDMPETRLFAAGKKQSYFGVRRFDRGPENHRFHVHTFGNLIHADFRVPSKDYVDLMKVTLALTGSQAEMLRAFRRMVFNIAAHNRDDHVKNFAYLMDDLGGWTLSPAYDLVFAAGPGGEHTMTVAGEGFAPRRDHVLRLAKQCDIEPKEAIRILDETNSAIARWREFADAAGLSKKRIVAIERYFVQL